MRRIVEKLWVLVLARVLMAAGFSLSFPFLALYLNKERGVPMGWVGSLLAFNILASAFTAAVGGVLSDRYGRKPVMVSSMAARCIVLFAVYHAIDVQAHFLWIWLLHFASATLGSLFDPAASAWVADQLPHNERVHAYGLVRTGGNLGWAIGPALGGLAAAHGYALMFLGTAVAYAAVTAIVAFAIQDSERGAPAERFRLSEELAALSDPKLLRICLGVMVLGVAMSQLIAPLSLYAVRFRGLSEREVGLLFSINGALVAVCQVALMHGLRTRRLTSMLIAGAALYGLGYGLLGFAEGFRHMAALMALITLGEMVCAPAEHALAANIAPPSERGRYIGIVTLATQVGWAAGPLAAGWLLESLGPMHPCPYWLGVAAVGLSAAAIFTGLREKVTLREEGIELLNEPAGQPAV